MTVLLSGILVVLVAPLIMPGLVAAGRRLMAGGKLLVKKLIPVMIVIGRHVARGLWALLKHIFNELVRIVIGSVLTVLSVDWLFLEQVIQAWLIKHLLFLVSQ